MSEELTLLPCPVCEEQPCMLGEQVVCCKINVEGITAWNALPRALTWTTEPPIKDGWYFAQIDTGPAFTCQVFNAGTETAFFTLPTPGRAGSLIAISDCTVTKWAGPVPLPKEPS